MEPIYMLCGENGLLIKLAISFSQAQRLLNRYCKGQRYVRRFNSLAEAQLFAVSYAAEHGFSGQCLRTLKPNQMVLFKNLEHAIEPMLFDDFATIHVTQQEK